MDAHNSAFSPGVEDRHTAGVTLACDLSFGTESIRVVERGQRKKKSLAVYYQEKGVLIRLSSVEAPSQANATRGALQTLARMGGGRSQEAESLSQTGVLLLMDRAEDLIHEEEVELVGIASASSSNSWWIAGERARLESVQEV